MEDIPDLDEHIHSKAKAETPHEEPKKKVERPQRLVSHRKHDDDSDFSIETSRLEDIDPPVQVAEKKPEQKKVEPAKPHPKDAEQSTA